MTDIDSIISRVKKYNSEVDSDLLRRVYDFAAKAHTGQQRLTGDPYIAHPLATAGVLAELEMDATSIVAALLHDVVEDQDYTIDDIKSEFGAEVAGLVDGVTKLKHTDFDVGMVDEEDESRGEEIQRSGGWSSDAAPKTSGRSSWRWREICA